MSIRECSSAVPDRSDTDPPDHSHGGAPYVRPHRQAMPPDSASGRPFTTAAHDLGAAGNEFDCHRTGAPSAVTRAAAPSQGPEIQRLGLPEPIDQAGLMLRQLIWMRHRRQLIVLACR
jgi:hypothetical protein